MATTQAASSGGTPNIGENIVGSHTMKIECFSRTKDLGVGKSIKSTTFDVGGHCWYIECYPCGDVEKNAGRVSLFLSLSDHKEQVEAGFSFYTLVDEDDEAGCLIGHYKYNYNEEINSWQWGSDDIKRTQLESLLKDDCLKVGCVVSIGRDFPAVPPLDLHPPLSDLLASRMPGNLATIQVAGELFTIHRGLPGPSAKVAASTTSAASASTAVRSSTTNVAGSHVITINGYSNVKKVVCPGETIISDAFFVGGQEWYLKLYPSGEKVKDNDCLPIFLAKSYGPAVKVRFELTQLTLAREVTSSMQSCYAFTRGCCYCRCYFPFNMEPGSSPLQDNFHVKFDVTVIKEITPMRPPDLHQHFGDLLASKIGSDIEFEVGGELFSAHKCVLAARSKAFLVQFFGPAEKGSNTTTVTRVLIEDMEPGVFKSVLHFIYTDALPEVYQDDERIVMARGLLLAADRYGMERLKLICADILCNYVNDAGTAVAMLELAYKHGCRRLMEACIKLLKDHFPKVAP